MWNSVPGPCSIKTRRRFSHSPCALKRPSASHEVDIIKSENDLRFKYAVF